MLFALPGKLQLPQTLNQSRSSCGVAGQVPVAEARQKILKQEQSAVPVVEARQTILKQELQFELKGALEGRKAPSLPMPDDSSQAAGGAPDNDRKTTDNEPDAQVGRHQPTEPAELEESSNAIAESSSLCHESMPEINTQMFPSW